MKTAKSRTAAPRSPSLRAVPLRTARRPRVLADATPGLAIPPGNMLRQELAERKITQASFAKLIGRPLQAVNEIIKGKKSITADTAIAFESALSIPAELWLNLEAGYQLALARQRRRSLRSA